MTGSIQSPSSAWSMVRLNGPSMRDIHNNVNTGLAVLQVRKSNLDCGSHCLTDSAKLLVQFSLSGFVVHRESAQGVQRHRHECI